MENNYCVIMSGGIGSRFWPASRSKYPKQFLDFFGTGQSLLQQTFYRFNKIIPKENIFIVSNQLYGKLIQEQLPEIDPKQVLLEPQRRNTAPCIAYASHHIRAINPKANIVVAPSDHIILKENEFIERIRQGLEFVASNEVLLTIGIKPNRPETGYGYIQKGHQKMAGFTKAKAFTEKPNLELAKVFVDSGEFLWNSGIFLWNVQSILKAFEQFLPEIHASFTSGKRLFNTNKEADFIAKIFSTCPNISIDYSIMEKAPNVYVQEGNFGWSDLGTWGSLHTLSDKDNNNNVVLKCKAMFYDCRDNIITLPEGKLAVIQKLEGYIIAESDNVLMICKKEDEQEIRQFVIDAQLKYGDSFV